MTKALTEFWKSLMGKDSDIVTSKQSIHTGTATSFLAKIGDISNSLSHGYLITFNGMIRGFTTNQAHIKGELRYQT